jgi:hypothetical protein
LPAEAIFEFFGKQQGEEGTEHMVPYGHVAAVVDRTGGEHLSALSPCVLPILPIVLGSAFAQHRWGRSPWPVMLPYRSPRSDCSSPQSAFRSI